VATRDTGQYFMKASPVRPGDYIEFFAEIDLLGALSACAGGGCLAEHSSRMSRPVTRLRSTSTRPEPVRWWDGRAPGEAV